MLDADIFAFLAARAEDAGQEPLRAPASHTELRELVALANCQEQTTCGALPRLAALLLQAAMPGLQDWPGASRREHRLQALRHAAAAGNLHAMLGLVMDRAQRERDEAAREGAVQQAVLLSNALKAEAAAAPAPARQEAGRRSAQDTAAAIGLVCIMGVLLLEMLG